MAGRKPPGWAIGGPDLPVMSGLVAWWAPNNQAKFIDLTGNGFHATPNASFPSLVTSNTPLPQPIKGSLYHSPGMAGYWSEVDSPTGLLSLTSFTLAAWVQVDSIGSTNGGIIGFGAGSSVAWRVQSSGVPQLLKALVVGDTTATIALTVSKWAHIAVSHDGTTVKYYVNGVLDASGTFSQSFTNTTVRLGISSGFADQFEGKIGDIRIYNRILEGHEVHSIYGWGAKQPQFDDFILGEMPIQAATTVTDDVPFSQSTGRNTKLGLPVAPPLDTIGATTYPHTVQPDLWASPVSQPRNPPRRHLSEMLVAPVAPSFFVDNGADHWFQPTPIIRGRRRENRVLDQDFFGDPGGTPHNYGFFQQPDARRPKYQPALGIIATPDGADTGINQEWYLQPGPRRPKRQPPTAFWDTYAPAAADTGIAQGWYEPTYRIQRPWRAPAAFNVVEDASQAPSFEQTQRPARRPGSPVSFNVVDDATFTPAYQQSQRFAKARRQLFQPSGPIDDADAQGFYREEIPPRPLPRSATSSVTSQPQATAAAYVMAADTGVFTLNGQDATLTYTPVVEDTGGHSAGWPPAYTKEQLEQFLEKRRLKPAPGETPAAVQVVQVSPLVEPVVQPKIGPLGPLGAVGQAVAGDPEPIDESEVIELIAKLEQELAELADEAEDEETAIQVILGLI